MAKPIPDGSHTLTPMIVFKDARKAIEFYKAAFGAVEREVFPSPDGKRIMHAAIVIGDSPVMMTDEHPQHPCKSALTIGDSPISFYVYVKDVDAAYKRAVAGGAVSLMPVQDMFWGDRVGNVKDPFGHSWMFATHIQDLTPEQMRKGAEAAFANQPGQ